jgi:hypothetical protein
MTLQQEPRQTIKYMGQEYPFHPYFNRVLTLLSEVFPNEIFTDYEKIEIAVTSLSEAPVCQDVFELILLELFPKNKHASEQKTMDFEQDASLIYAGFKQAYGIDLFAERNKMDWRIFLALLRGLPENTEFSRVVKLRCTKIPARNKNNSDYVDSLVKAKMAVALDEPEEDVKKRMAQKWIEIAEGLMNVRR